MRRRLLILVCLLVFAIPGFAKDIYLSIGGSANGFFTDARIVNPSFTKDITITARYLPAGNIDNSGVTPKTITVAKRSMAIYDDVVQALFPGSPALGAIRLTSDDDFIATQRIYADKRTSRQGGTLGQFVPGLEPATAKKKGVIPQLKSGQATLGNFRTNVGGANPNAVTATVNFRLYDRQGNVAGTNTLTFQPFGVFSPSNITGFFGDPNRDLTDSWISYDSDQPVFIYGSVVDNGSEDPTFIPAFEDSGVEPPAPQQKTVTVTASSFFFVVTPSATLRAGDEVRFIISSADGDHGYQLIGPTGQNLIAITLLRAGQPAVERIITLPASGTYSFFCLNNGCGEGHTAMTGTMSVATAANN